jgi:hypothetical protein
MDPKMFNNEINARKAVDDMMAMWDTWGMVIGMVAKMKWEYYTQLLKQGFTPIEALQLTIAFNVSKELGGSEPNGEHS